MPPTELPPPDSNSRRTPAGLGDTSGTGQALAVLTLHAFQLRFRCRYALHPVEAALQYHRSEAAIPGEEGHGCFGFEEAEAHYRAGAQGLRLPEIPQLPQQLRELSRLGPVDRAGRKALRKWAEDHGHVVDDDHFFQLWIAQGKRGGAEHQVYHDQEAGRWIKRLYHGVNSSTFGDYLARMRLHAVLFPETAYRLEGFTINPKNKELAPVVSQPHVEVDIRVQWGRTWGATTILSCANEMRMGMGVRRGFFAVHGQGESAPERSGDGQRQMAAGHSPLLGGEGRPGRLVA